MFIIQNEQTLYTFCTVIPVKEHKSQYIIVFFFENSCIKQGADQERFSQLVTELGNRF